MPGVVPAPPDPSWPPSPRRRPLPGRCRAARRGAAARDPAERRQREKEAAQGTGEGASEGPGREGREAAGPVTGFLASCWAELKRVQWPDRDTLVQASAVTLIFVMVMAAYLGALDAAFNWIIQRII